MRCRDLGPVLAGWLYREISPGEEEALKRHLDGCEACRREIERLDRARAILREARPEVPAPPRILILRPRGPAAWPVAAALAGAVVLASGSAFLAGRASRRPAAAPAANSPVAVSGQREPDEAVLPVSQPRDATAEPVVTQQQLDRRLAELERRLRRQREADIHDVLAEIAGLEQRTSARIARTQDALRYVALASSPGISEQ